MVIFINLLWFKMKSQNSSQIHEFLQTPPDWALYKSGSTFYFSPFHSWLRLPSTTGSTAGRSWMRTTSGLWIFCRIVLVQRVIPLLTGHKEAPATEQHLVQCLGKSFSFFFIALRTVKSSTPPLSPAICSIISHSTTSPEPLRALEKQLPNNNLRNV